MHSFAVVVVTKILLYFHDEFFVNENMFNFSLNLINFKRQLFF